MVWLQVKSANYSAACETELWLPGNHQASEGLAWCKSPPVLSSKVSAMHPFFQHCYMKVCDACTIKNFIMICRYCCKSSTFQSRLASLHRFALLMTPTSCFFFLFLKCFEVSFDITIPFFDCSHCGWCRICSCCASTSNCDCDNCCTTQDQIHR